MLEGVERGLRRLTTNLLEYGEQDQDRFSDLEIIACRSYVSVYGSMPLASKNSISSEIKPPMRHIPRPLCWLTSPNDE